MSAGWPSFGQLVLLAFAVGFVLVALLIPAPLINPLALEYTP